GQPVNANWRPTHVLRHPSGYVNSIEFASDGRRLMSATVPDHSAWVWDLEGAGRLVVGPLSHDAAPAWLVLSEDGRRAVTATESGIVRVWDARTGSPLSGAMRHPMAIEHLRFAPDDPRVVLTSHAGPP